MASLATRGRRSLILTGLSQSILNLLRSTITGRHYDKLGDHRRAIADYDRAVEINPEYPEAYNNRGGAYGALGDQRRAIADYDRAIEINPEYPRHIITGCAYGALGDQRQAIADYDRAIGLSPKTGGDIL